MSRPEDLNESGELFTLPAGPGRRYDPDPRDDNFPAQAKLPSSTQIEREYRYWNNLQARLHQGRTGTCVGHGWIHLKENGPWTFEGTANPFDFYRKCVREDRWSQNDHEATALDHQLQFGTSVRAGAKVAQKEGWGGEYRWARDVEVVADWILERSPVVFGTRWSPSMVPGNLEERADGQLFLPVPDNVRTAQYGHAYEADGVNKPQEKIRFLNSWRTMEIFWMTFEDVQKLLDANGEACMITEIGGS